ncbi:hydroxyacylglutathione hydrolase [Marinovum sp. 2_MG-2023]|uniref:hydroxyacylglutathione hydrolase n=1 Tax=unclassified Marinovum TaxID=2647166 RepID=UPI0026E37F49|nr:MULTISPECIES: hydroxyacylglutathione hydrolase [unclassified Marinovum]MDO6728564.1 hydroxyacylglutathione hydrolase [Marinovum sp. 2_MG-2023]MDO6778020.1 hydroxyacylglutathione hydrolase [Marinovum sp. 1_MG-2023]
MPLELVTIPCLSDNYTYLMHDAQSGETAVFDVPEAGPILSALETRGWTLSHIFLTHHHWDHVDGTADLLRAAPARVIGAKADAHRLPPLDQQVVEGDSIAFGGEEVTVLDVPGHTIGHVAYHLPKSGFLVTMDSLMALGCGRLFEGTPDMMMASMQKMAALPPDTVICSGHEYAETNFRFAMTIEPGNNDLISRGEEIAAARAAGRATVPTTLAQELATNPFLRAHVAAVKTAVALADGDPVSVFAEVRKRRDSFK